MYCASTSGKFGRAPALAPATATARLAGDGQAGHGQAPHDASACRIQLSSSGCRDLPARDRDDPPAAVDHERLGQRRGPVGRGELDVGVDDVGIGQVVAAQEVAASRWARPRRSRRAPSRRAWPASSGRAASVWSRRRSRAPRGPEVEHDDVAAQVGQGARRLRAQAGQDARRVGRHRVAAGLDRVVERRVGRLLGHAEHEQGDDRPCGEERDQRSEDAALHRPEGYVAPGLSAAQEQRRPAVRVRPGRRTERARPRGRVLRIVRTDAGRRDSFPSTINCRRRRCRRHASSIFLPSGLTTYQSAPNALEPSPFVVPGLCR